MKRWELWLIVAGALAGFLLGFFVLAQTPCLDCPDPSRPWMRGNIEKSCAMTQAAVDKLREENPDRADRILLCACQHACDPTQTETEGRKWDARCEARCNPRNCTCEHPCL